MNRERAFKVAAKAIVRSEMKNYSGMKKAPLEGVGKDQESIDKVNAYVSSAKGKKALKKYAKELPKGTVKKIVPAITKIQKSTFEMQIAFEKGESTDDAVQGIIDGAQTLINLADDLEKKRQELERGMVDEILGSTSNPYAEYFNVLIEEEGQKVGADPRFGYMSNIFGAIKVLMEFQDNINKFLRMIHGKEDSLGIIQKFKARRQMRGALKKLGEGLTDALSWHGAMLDRQAAITDDAFLLG